MLSHQQTLKCLELECNENLTKIFSSPWSETCGYFETPGTRCNRELLRLSNSPWMTLFVNELVQTERVNEKCASRWKRRHHRGAETIEDAEIHYDVS